MMTAYPRPIMLGSRSPRRQSLLKQVGVAFELLDFELMRVVREMSPRSPTLRGWHLKKLSLAGKFYNKPVVI